MSRKNKIIISISGIVIVLLLLLGLTYGFYLTRINGNSSDKSVTVSLANLELTYSDGNGLVESNNMVPGESITKTFTVENTGNKKVINYLIYLEDVINTFEDKNDLKVTLTCTSNTGTCNGNTLTYPSSDTVIGVNDIEVKEKQEFSLKVEFLETNDDQNDNQNKTFSGNVKLKDMKSTNTKLVSNEGTNILELNNAKSINHLLVYGNSTQEVRSGKNLFDETAVTGNVIANGTVEKIENGYRATGNYGAASGLSYANGWLRPGADDNGSVYLENGTTVTISANIRLIEASTNIKTDNNYSNIYLYSNTANALTKNTNIKYNTDGTITKIYETYTITENGKYYPVFTLNNNKLEITNIQIEIGNTATDYEAYGATPSPDIPSEINSVGDLVTDTTDTHYGKYKIPITTSSKNLIPYPYASNDGTYNGVSINTTEDGNITLNGTATANIMFNIVSESNYLVLDEDTYTFSVTSDNTLPSKVEVWLRRESTSEVYNGVKQNHNISTDSSKKWKIYITIDKDVTVNATINVQLESGSTATDYVPYKKETTNIYLDEPLRKIGDKSDYIDLKNGKVVRNIDSYTFSGDENFVTEENTKLYSFRKIEGMPSSNSVNSLSNRYRITSQNYNSITDSSLFQYGNSYINLGNAGKSTVSEFKEWLKSNTVKVIWSTSNENTETASLPSILTDESTKTIKIGTNTKPSKTQIEYVQ